MDANSCVLVFSNTTTSGCAMLSSRERTCNKALLHEHRTTAKSRLKISAVPSSVRMGTKAAHMLACAANLRSVQCLLKQRSTPSVRTTLRIAFVAAK